MNPNKNTTVGHAAFTSTVTSTPIHTPTPSGVTLRQYYLGQVLSGMGYDQIVSRYPAIITNARAFVDELLKQEGDV